MDIGRTPIVQLVSFPKCLTEASHATLQDAPCMTVMTPIKTDYTQRDAAMASGASQVATRSTHWTVCATVLLVADAIGFALATALAAGIAWEIEAQAMEAGGPVGNSILSGIIALGVAVAFMAQRSHYRRRVPFWSELRDVIGASVIALVCDGFLQYVLWRHDARLFIGLSWILFPALLVLSRSGARAALAAAGLWQLRALVIGTGETARQAGQALTSEAGLGYTIVGAVPSSEPGLRMGEDRWARVMRDHGADLLVLALDPSDEGGRQLTESLVRERVPFAAMPRMDGLPVLGFEQTNFFSHDTVMFSYRNNLAQPVARAVKIAFDLSAAICLLAVLSPLLALLAIAVKLDGGAALFGHKRLGANGREFRCLKFRSMVTNGDEVLRALLDSNPEAAAEWAETRKLKNDPRITRIGSILRATSLDELPQLFNVLRLEMSLVGPRPIVRAEAARYGDDISYYYETRPGLTGLWQVSGRSDTSYERRVQLDTWYVKNWTIWHDLAILFKTVPAVLKRQGAV